MLVFDIVKYLSIRAYGTSVGDEQYFYYVKIWLYMHFLYKDFTVFCKFKGVGRVCSAFGFFFHVVKHLRF
jgi:hypothetical protein